MTGNAFVVFCGWSLYRAIAINELALFPLPSTDHTNHWARMKEGSWIDFSMGDLNAVSDTTNARARAENVDVSYEKGHEGGR
jgi:hypothetical protein